MHVSYLTWRNIGKFVLTIEQWHDDESSIQWDQKIVSDYIRSVGIEVLNSFCLSAKLVCAGEIS